jgi:pimeloyl-ACP methyl ester carboxylesterase
MKTALVNRVSISYRDEGEGKPLIFLHAFPLSQRMWDDQVAAFSGTRRVITFDWRGFGESSLAESSSDMTAFADDLAALMDFLGIERAVICGLSMGGYAALSFLRTYADRLEALILADTRATADTDEGRRNRLAMTALVREDGPTAIVEQMTSRLLGAKSLRNNPGAVQRVRKMIEANRSEGIARALLGMAARPDSTALLSEIRCPTLIVVGQDDILTPPSESEAMAREIAGSKLAIIPGVGHLPNIEAPEEFNRILAEFLSSQP